MIITYFLSILISKSIKYNSRKHEIKTFRLLNFKLKKFLHIPFLLLYYYYDDISM